MKLLGIGLTVVGGYVVAKMLGYDPLAFLEHSMQTTPLVSSPQANDVISTAGATKDLVISAARTGGVSPTSYQSSDIWDYFYQRVRGIPAPSPEDLFPGADRNKMYSIDEWWVAMVKKGMSGLGMIAHFNPYYNPNGQAFGNNLMANGIENLRIIRSN